MPVVMRESVEPASEAAPVSKARVRTGQVISGFIVLFLLFDSFGKFFKPTPVVEGFARLGFPVSLSVTIGTLLLVSTILYVIARTAVLGAILLTGYLGGAVASQLRIGEPLLGYVLFPVYCGVLLWAGLVLRDKRLSAVIFRRS
ncbi:MAG: DoxX family protein [Acidobacteriota bacterium]